MEAYIPRLLHALHEDDPDRRLKFCEQFLLKCDERKYFQDSIVWLDEAHLKLMVRLIGIIVCTERT